jgi:pimeloyl-ACP methyl ester carboxylesterase
MPCIDTGRVSMFFEDAGSGAPPVLLLHELGGCSESWRAVIALLAPDRRVIAVDMRCAGRSEKPPGPLTMADVADDLDALLRSLNLAAPVDVIGAALGSLAGTLLALRHPARVRRLMMCAVAPDMTGPTRTYLAERAEKVRVAGMRGVAEASLANSFPTSHPEARAAYRGIYLGNDSPIDFRQKAPGQASPARYRAVPKRSQTAAPIARTPASAPALQPGIARIAARLAILIASRSDDHGAAGRSWKIKPGTAPSQLFPGLKTSDRTCRCRYRR